ncbi:MAG: hypothetical protein KW804_02360 [Candidatus Doudnabacteria bacterium]|nr:hypothetical protein [Candidatus Doudnabacteria bacterium]
MLGPRAEILVYNLITIPLTVAIGLWCVSLVMKSQATNVIWYAWWVPIIAMSVAGLGAAADIIIHRQYEVLGLLGDSSAPPVKVLSGLLVALAHIVALVPLFTAIYQAERLVWAFNKADLIAQAQYLRLTLSGLGMALIVWVTSAVYRGHLK